MKGLLFILFLATVIGCEGSEKEYSEALRELDRAIARKDEIVLLKEAKIDSLKKEMLLFEDCLDCYSIEEKIYHEYARYDVDSALVYAHLKETTAMASGDRNAIFDAAMDLADLYWRAGEFGPALDIVNEVDTSGISVANRVAYYSVLKNIHRGLSQTGIDPALNDFNHEKMLEYVDLIQQEKDFITADNADLSIKGQNSGLARQIILDNYSSGAIADKAQLYFFLAKTYRAEGDRENEILHLAISAKYDIDPKMSVSRSLIRLAGLLYEDGYTSRSFKYLSAAYDIAVKSCNRVALEEANTFLPQVISSYEALKRSQSRRLVAVMLLLFCLVIMLILAVIRINKVMVSNLKLQSIIKEENTHINEMNARLERQIIQIKENNKIKDAYLGRYMSMFSEHIDSLERFRSKLRVIAKSQDLQEVQKSLRSDDSIEEEQQVLMNEFDKTFLGIFPNFIEEFNNLLKEDCRIGKDLKPMTLSNELRIFALIRLGVSDSASIARFLRKSRSLVYNYRVKMRNGALTGREDFENQLMKIGPEN